MAQDYPMERMEIIISDGMSDDGTREIISEIQKQYSNIKMIDNPKKIVAAGLNQAIREARGEVIVRVDGHTLIAKDYVRQCVEALKDSKWDVVGGPIVTVGETYLAQVIAIAMSSVFGVGGSAFRTIRDQEMESETVPFPAYRRNLFERAGLFDEELVRNQDDEHNYRIRKQGGHILLTPRIQSQYYSRSTLKSLWMQYFQYGYWKVRVLQKHPGQMKMRQFIPPLFTFCLISAAILYGFGFPRLWSAILFLYVLANLAASVRLAAQYGWKYFGLLPVIFFILHLSYGIGFLTGLVQFSNRWGQVQP